MKLICGGHFKFQRNLEQIACTSPYRHIRGECDSKIWIIPDSGFEFLRPQQIIKLNSGRYFAFW